MKFDWTMVSVMVNQRESCTEILGHTTRAPLDEYDVPEDTYLSWTTRKKQTQQSSCSARNSGERRV